jgi:hypothetical protein
VKEILVAFLAAVSGEIFDVVVAGDNGRSFRAGAQGASPQLEKRE